MRNALKQLISQNPYMSEAHRIFLFFKDIPLADYANTEKLRLMRKVRPYTMIPYPRLSNVYILSKLMEKQGQKGAFVECGVWKGGAAAIMAYVASQTGSGRKTWLFDSFEGLPEPTNQDGRKAEVYAAGKISGKLSSIGKCVGPLEDVQRLFSSILDIDQNNVVIQQGWFQDTLPRASGEIGPIAILRLDADWYESTKCCLEYLYDNVVPGGYVILDDYGFWEGCRKAVDEFLENRNLKVELKWIDHTGVYFEKP